MRSLLILGFFLPLLTGCLVDNMERITEETRDSVKDSNSHIAATAKGQRLAAGLELIVSEKAPRNLRVGGAETVIILADESRLGIYLATIHSERVVLTAQNVDALLIDGADVREMRIEVPNVSLVGKPLAKGEKEEDRKEYDPELQRSATRAETYGLFTEALFNPSTGAVDKLIKGSISPETSIKDWPNLIEIAHRVTLAATALAGAMPMDKTHDMLVGIDLGRSMKESRSYVLSEKDRRIIAAKLLDIARLYGFNSADTTRLIGDCDVKMGIRLE